MIDENGKRASIYDDKFFELYKKHFDVLQLLDNKGLKIELDHAADDYLRAIDTDAVIMDGYTQGIERILADEYVSYINIMKKDISPNVKNLIDIFNNFKSTQLLSFEAINDKFIFFDETEIIEELINYELIKIDNPVKMKMLLNSTIVTNMPNIDELNALIDTGLGSLRNTFDEYVGTITEDHFRAIWEKYFKVLNSNNISFGRLLRNVRGEKLHIDFLIVKALVLGFKRKLNKEEYISTANIRHGAYVNYINKYDELLDSVFSEHYNSHNKNIKNGVIAIKGYFFNSKEIFVYRQNFDEFIKQNDVDLIIGFNAMTSGSSMLYIRDLTEEFVNKTMSVYNKHLDLLKLDVQQKNTIKLRHFYASGFIEYLNDKYPKEYDLSEYNRIVSKYLSTIQFNKLNNTQRIVIDMLKLTIYETSPTMLLLLDTMVDVNDEYSGLSKDSKVFMVVVSSFLNDVLNTVNVSRV